MERFLLAPEERARCTRLADALQVERAKFPKGAKWHTTGPLDSAIKHLREMAEYGNGGGVLPYTADPVIIALAAEHEVAIAPSVRTDR